MTGSKITSCVSLSRNIRIVPDYPELSSVSVDAHERYDVLILPGGAPGAKTFCGDNTVLDLINEFRKRAKWVAAICAATTALVAAHKRDDGTRKVTTTVTSHPSVKDEVVQAGWQYSEERVVVDQISLRVGDQGLQYFSRLPLWRSSVGRRRGMRLLGR